MVAVTVVANPRTPRIPDRSSVHANVVLDCFRMSDTRFSVDDLVQIRVGRGRIVLASPPAVAPSQSKNERNDEHAEHDAQNTDQPLETGESTRRRSLAPLRVGGARRGRLWSAGGVVATRLTLGGRRLAKRRAPWGLRICTVRRTRGSEMPGLLRRTRSTATAPAVRTAPPRAVASG